MELGSNFAAGHNTYYFCLLEKWEKIKNQIYIDQALIYARTLCKEREKLL